MQRLWSAAALAAAVLAVAACASSNSSSSSDNPAVDTASSSPASPTMILTRKIGERSVLTNAKGLTLYWYSADTSTRSNCTGACATYWPPVTGPATAGPGVTGTLGTITRPGGKVQATYDGHPLYTYIGDTAPGQHKGNGLKDAGGVWHAMTDSGHIAALKPRRAASASNPAAVPASNPAAVPPSTPAPARTHSSAPAPARTHSSAPSPTPTGGGGYGY
jgi:predicted lipoprotein with Yx(FWY)xxD motif